VWLPTRRSAKSSVRKKMRDKNMEASFMRFIAFPPVSYVPLSVL
jgi:hypothetical protein